MWLDCGQFGKVTLDRVAPGIVVAKDEQTIPPGMVVLFVSVDGAIQQHSVRLVSAFRGRVAKFSFDDGTPF
jgi:hypothetical protein